MFGSTNPRPLPRPVIGERSWRYPTIVIVASEMATSPSLAHVHVTAKMGDQAQSLVDSSSLLAG